MTYNVFSETLSLTQSINQSTNVKSASEHSNVVILPRCMECRRGLAMKILSVCPSVKRVNCEKRKINLSGFLYHTKEHLA